MYEFEFDANKSQLNLQKHGIDFTDAQQIWVDPSFFEISARFESEDRRMVIGQIEGKHWSAIITYRNSVIRIISVRRSRKAEIEAYEG